MSDAFVVKESLGNHNYGFPMDHPDQSAFELSDYLVFDEALEQLDANPIFPAEVVGDSEQISGVTINSDMKCMNERKRIKMESGYKIAFRTKSEHEVLDDGFKWRKYGKKSVKNSPNPRNYYKCSNGGCPVKKRVERDGEDSSYVITTYEGVHNHQSPFVIYYTPHPQIPSMVPSPWSLQVAHSSSTS